MHSESFDSFNLSCFFIVSRFDTELQILQDELRAERVQKERSMRERDAATSDKLTAEQMLQVRCQTIVFYHVHMAPIITYAFP